LVWSFLPAELAWCSNNSKRFLAATSCGARQVMGRNDA